MNMERRFDLNNPEPGLYRYIEDFITNDGDVIVGLNKYTILKTTACGFWIDYPFNRMDRKWVQASGQRIFAFQKEEDALYNFRRRKQKQIRILEHKLRLAKESLIQAEVIKRVKGYTK